MVIFGAFLYTALFYSEKMGLNTLLFSVFVISILFYFFPEERQSKGTILAATGTLLTATLVVWHNSFLAKTMYIFSFLLLTGFAHRRTLRFIWFGLIISWLNYIAVPINAFKQFLQFGPNKQKFKDAGRWVKLIFLPLLIMGFFYILYYYANAQFANLSDRFWSSFSGTFHWQWPGAKTWRTLFGCFILGALLWPSKMGNWLHQKESLWQFNLTRRINRHSGISRFFSMLALKQEFSMALIAIGMLNGLLFLVNIIDLRFVWIAQENLTAAHLSQYVHEGTYLLILAIFLAMGVLLFFFRRNLNFYPQNKILVQLANFWLLQNAVLALSVGLRNYQYILHYGLAYKRLGVLLFLVLVLAGLWTLYLKIKHRRSLFYLFNVNGWALYLALILACFVQWDNLITHYNIKHSTTRGIDVSFLIHKVSDKNLYLLKKYQHRLKEKGYYYSSIDRAIEQKQELFTMKNQTYSWRSWNWADEKNKHYLKQFKSY